MDKTLCDLLRIDSLARQFGCGLKPELKKMIEADLRFPTHAASPNPINSTLSDPLPNNVIKLDEHRTKLKRAQA